MAFRLLEITKPEELQEWTPVFWEANSNPPMSGHNALMPVKGDTLSAKTAAIEDAKQRYIGMLEHDPDAHLLKVIDINNAVLGGGYWEIYETNPFANPPPNFEIYWWPEGSDSRKFVEMMFMQRGASRVQRQQRPHIRKKTCSQANNTIRSISKFSDDSLTDLTRAELLLYASRIPSSRNSQSGNELGNAESRRVRLGLFR